MAAVAHSGFLTGIRGIQWGGGRPEKERDPDREYGRRTRTTEKHQAALDRVPKEDTRFRCFFRHCPELWLRVLFSHCSPWTLNFGLWTLEAPEGDRETKGRLRFTPLRPPHSAPLCASSRVRRRSWMFVLLSVLLFRGRWAPTGVAGDRGLGCDQS